MGGSDGGIPDYEARCGPDYLSFTYRESGEEARQTRDIDIKLLINGASPELLIAWASFQTLCGIDSGLRQLNEKLDAIVNATEKASTAAVARMPDPTQLLAMIGGIRPPRAEPIHRRDPD